MEYETVLCEAHDHIVTVTLNRPEKLNSFNERMCAEFEHIWQTVRSDDDVHVVVLRAAGDRAFCTGVDVKEGVAWPTNVWNQDDPGARLSPKHNKVWKPLICALHGMTAGGAFYWINEADIVICAPDTTFFDPHVTYGMTAALEPIGLSRRIPLGDVLRIALLGLDERVTADRALEIGLVTEIVPRERLWERAHELATLIAAKPPAAIQGTVKAIWESLDMTRSQAIQMGMSYTQLGNPIGTAGVDRATVTRPQPMLR